MSESLVPVAVISLTRECNSSRVNCRAHAVLYFWRRLSSYVERFPTNGTPAAINFLLASCRVLPVPIAISANEDPSSLIRIARSILNGRMDRLSTPAASSRLRIVPGETPKSAATAAIDLPQRYDEIIAAVSRCFVIDGHTGAGLRARRFTFVRESPDIRRISFLETPVKLMSLTLSCNLGTVMDRAHAEPYEWCSRQGTAISSLPGFHNRAAGFVGTGATVAFGATVVFGAIFGLGCLVAGRKAGHVDASPSHAQAMRSDRIWQNR